jgi:hypothetical protein
MQKAGIHGSVVVVVALLMLVLLSCCCCCLVAGCCSKTSEFQIPIVVNLRAKTSI